MNVASLKVHCRVDAGMCTDIGEFKRRMLTD